MSTIEIFPLQAFNDNYIWLIKNYRLKQCAVIDPGDATPVINWLQSHRDWQLTDILSTHHHPDHTGGVVQLKQLTHATVYGSAQSQLNFIDTHLTSAQTISVLEQTIKIINALGHTLDHIMYYLPTTKPPILFSGDTLFIGGCGRIFEATYQQMYETLQQILLLQPHTLIYCGHEYTLSNLKFAEVVEPENQIIKKFINKCVLLRNENQPTIPSTLENEQLINPFLRCNVPSVREAAEKHIGKKLKTSLEVFTVLREWKNNF